MRKQLSKREARIVDAQEDFLIDAQFNLQSLVCRESKRGIMAKAGIRFAQLCEMEQAEKSPTLRQFTTVFKAFGYDGKIVERLNDLIKKRKIGRARLAVEAGISHRRLVALLTGKGDVSVRRVAAVFYALGEKNPKWGFEV
jgi:hypothetical protein